MHGPYSIGRWLPLCARGRRDDSDCQQGTEQSHSEVLGHLARASAVAGLSPVLLPVNIEP
jgi:hypothetical protein